ncbi:Type IV secretion system protein VirB6 [Tsuneonella dongtanensis]|uniref:Type IV secretion system protein VirB6 n=1 Tax=Tsuneonella dongtanensis TaxID=692370 RepID=A0A1B2ABN6_9SPHN|nr:type IV secretion system protein [Tsuneonella dongtanensis]ANY19521.1 Type IV secretion system protein VirB6 [Tsuneonella dongtanensis]
MSAACDQAAKGVGNGVAAALQAVDCVAAETTAAAFGRLFAPGGALVTVLTILLTLFVAWFGINLLLGRANLSVRSLTPRMMTIGVVLTLVTSWVAYSTLLWNLAVGGPDWIAGVITGARESATQVFAQKIDVVFQALQQASPQTEGKDIGAFSPEGMMWLGAMLFLLGTVGVLVTARIGLAVLVAIGPVFVVMALFPGTRGLFTGWLKGLVMLALVPLFAVLGGSVMLELAVPILAALVATPGQVDPQAAMAFFVVGAVHAALMIMVLKVAGTMVAGWRVFGLVPDKGDRGESGASAAPTVVSAAAAASPSAQSSAASDRRIPVAAFATAPAANDVVAASGGSRDTRVITNTVASGSGQAASAMPGTTRAKGVGSRFRAPPPRLSEKMK